MGLPALPQRITIREVGPRDGLQAEQPLAVADRVRLIDALVGAGLVEIEVAAFVSTKAVPSMAGAADVIAAVGRPRGVRIVALVPNVRGAEAAVAAGVDEITVTVSASTVYNQRNVRMTIDDSVEEVAGIRAAVGDLPVDMVVSCAFGSPYEGDVEPSTVAALAGRLLAAGGSSITLADTTGMATPRRLEEVLALTGADVGLHLHQTRGTALVNAFAGLQLGVTRFDTAVGGLGGSPFAAGAGGNLATEDLVHLCDDIGVETGVDLGRLLEAARLTAATLGHEVASPLAAVGPRSRIAT